MLIVVLLIGSWLINSSLPAYAITDIIPAPLTLSDEPRKPLQTSDAKKIRCQHRHSQPITSRFNKNTPWQYSFDRLNDHSKYHFSARFLDEEQLRNALDNDALDFVITDAINYVLLEKKYGLLRLLTRTEQYGDRFVSIEGLSVYTLNENSDINPSARLKR